MRTEFKVFRFIAVFFFVVAPIYWIMAHEIAGAVALLLSGAVGLIIAAYMNITGRKIDARYEDNPDAEVVDGTGELGFFPPSSIWPLWAAATLSLIVLGPIYGWWISIIGAGVGVWALTGWVFEFYRGDYSH